MVQFAAECLAKFQSLIHQLAMSLGGDTKHLSFRFGLHSGQVTAGKYILERNVDCCMVCSDEIILFLKKKVS